MAEEKRQNSKTHAYKLFNDDLKRDALKNIILLYGEEDYLKRWAAESIKSKFVNEVTEFFDFIRMDGAAVSAGEIIRACETMPVMSEYRVVMVEGFLMNALSKSDKRGSTEEIADRAADEVESTDPLDELTVYFENFPNTAKLVIICADVPDKRRKFFKNARKYGCEYNFMRLDRRTLMGFIKKRFSESGCSCSENLLLSIADISGYMDKETDTDLNKLFNYVKAIAAHSDGNIDEADIRAASLGNKHVYVFDFTDAMLERRKSDALGMLRQMLDGGENEFRLLGMICSQFETLLLASELSEAGYGYREAANKIKIHEYRMKLAYQKVLNYNSKEIKKLLMEAYAIDRNVKTGLMDIDVALELFVSNV